MNIEERVIATLKDNRETFQRYGDLHLAKNPPQYEKAATNYTQVLQINDTLLALGESVRSPDTIEIDRVALVDALKSMVADPEQFAAKLVSRLYPA